MKIKYNSPVILTYSLTAIALLTFRQVLPAGALFASPADLAVRDPLFWFRLVSYVLGHANWSHLMGNLTVILLVGPLLEEKYGSWRLFEMILVTAVVTALLNAFFFHTSLVGGSGIAFMLVLLGSFSNIRSGQIPLTFILVGVLFIGAEVVAILKIDRISQFSHLAGGLIGAAYGFFRGGRR